LELFNRNIALYRYMGLTKTDNFNTTQNRLAKLTKALGHPARIAILEILLKRNTCICGELVDELPLSQSTISQHLKELKEAGIIKGEIEGTSVCYCIDEKVWKEAQKALSKMFDLYKGDKNCC
jgi:DNA-binding transcriptional ArsR family regulator